MRDASLHIRRSHLIAIFINMGYTRIDAKHIVNDIFKAAQPYQITDRYEQLLEMSLDVRRNIHKDMKASLSLPDDGVEIFNRILNFERNRRQPYLRLRPITKSSKEYTLLKEVAVDAWKFVETFNISPKQDGILEYIRMGLDYMGKYNLRRFRYHHNQIVESFENKAHILYDENKELTADLYKAWQEAMIESGATDEMINVHKDFNKYVHFVYAAQDAASVGADAYSWINAQFDGLAFLAVIPELYQLYGVNAKKRYDSYLLQADEVDDTESLTDKYIDDNDD